MKLPCSNCQAALVSAELHIPSNELTSQEEDAPFRQHKSDSCITDESLSVGEFDVKDWWVLLVGAPMQMHNRRRHLGGLASQRRRNMEGLWVVWLNLLQRHVWHCCAF